MVKKEFNLHIKVALLMRFYNNTVYRFNSILNRVIPGVSYANSCHDQWLVTAIFFKTFFLFLHSMLKVSRYITLWLKKKLLESTTQRSMLASDTP